MDESLKRRLIAMNPAFANVLVSAGMGSPLAGSLTGKPPVQNHIQMKPTYGPSPDTPIRPTYAGPTPDIPGMLAPSPRFPEQLLPFNPTVGHGGNGPSPDVGGAGGSMLPVGSLRPMTPPVGIRPMTPPTGIRPTVPPTGIRPAPTPNMSTLGPESDMRPAQPWMNNFDFAGFLDAMRRINGGGIQSGGMLGRPRIVGL